MDELIARVLSGEASEVEVRRLDAWRSAAPGNERRYRDLAEVWSLGALDGVLAPARPAPAAADIVAEAERRRAAALPLATRRARRARLVWWAAAAAAAAVVVVGAGVQLRRAGAALEYAAAAGETRTVALADGSVVRLAPGARLRVRRADERSTELGGTAFFAVAADPARPFVVRTRAGTLSVLGTRFEVRSDADSLRLVVVEGRVRLGGAGGEAEVARGAVGRLTRGSRPTVEEVPDVWALLDWPGGVLLFQATELADVLGEVGARFGRPFVIRDSALARRRVTAWFEDEPLDSVVTAVCLVVGARCAVGDTIELRP